MGFDIPYALLQILASAYSSGVYGDEVYSGSSPLDSLANTGWDVLLPVLLGVSLVLAGLYLVVRKILSKRKTSNK